MRKNEFVNIPKNFDYENVGGLTNEVKEKLIKQSPQTLGQASRIPGITPAALSVLSIFVEKHNRSKNEMSVSKTKKIGM